MRSRAAVWAFAICAAAVGGAVAQETKPAEPPPAKAEPELEVEKLVVGTGRVVKADDDVLVHLAVSLADTGKVVMDTRREAGPQLFHVGANWTIPAIDLSLLQMRQGDRFKIKAPYRLAWGERGYSVAVPPKTDVVLDIEVVAFVELKTEVIKSGDGPTPMPSGFVLIHVVATLPDGKVVEDTRTDDAPALLQLSPGQMMQAWEGTLSRMKVGDRWKVATPWQLAYGAKGTKKVPPKTDVVFDFERLPIPEFKIDVLAAGAGPPVRPGQSVIVHFTSRLPDGKALDDTRAGGIPMAFTPGAQKVLPALELLVARMRIGARWRAVVPWQIAYGAHGRPPAVPGRTDVVFEVEVLDAR